jgi:hypothetical protein
MAKAPAIQFYVKDWLSDPQLKMASFSTKGIWIDMICYMWSAPKQGELSGTENELSKLLGASETEIKTFITDAQRLNFCDVRICDGNVRVINRRMVRDWKDKESARLRMQRSRGSDDALRECSQNVQDTPYIGDGDGDIIKDKKKYLECVFLTDDQHKKLLAKFGKPITEKSIFILNNYIMQKKRDPYVSHYHTLLGWPSERAMEKTGGDNGRGTGNRSAGPGTPIQARYIEEIPESLSEAERNANLLRVRELIR